MRRPDRARAGRHAGVSRTASPCCRRCLSGMVCCRTDQDKSGQTCPGGTVHRENTWRSYKMVGRLFASKLAPAVSTSATAFTAATSHPNVERFARRGYRTFHRETQSRICLQSCGYTLEREKLRLRCDTRRCHQFLQTEETLHRAGIAAIPLLSSAP